MTRERPEGFGDISRLRAGMNEAVEYLEDGRVMSAVVSLQIALARFNGKMRSEAVVGAPVEGECDESRMVKIGDLIGQLQGIKDRFGDTCIYVRAGGVGWGAVALNRRDDDEKTGVFDMEEHYSNRLMAYAGQVERLVADKIELQRQVAALTTKALEAP